MYNWTDGELITATKLNNMEDQIEENNMSYEKHTWANGEIITADKLNHMEEGIEGGGGGGSLLNKKITITMNNSANPIRMWESSYFISENGYVTKGTIEMPPNSQVVQDVMIPMSDETYYFDLPMVNNGETVSASNLVNCTFNYDGQYQDLVVTDPTEDASVTITYSRP